jgi:hypothetical protein
LLETGVFGTEGMVEFTTESTILLDEDESSASFLLLLVEKGSSGICLLDPMEDHVSKGKLEGGIPCLPGVQEEGYTVD